MTSPLKQQRNASSNNPADPVLISWQSPIPLPLTSLLLSPTVTSPLSLAAGNLDMSPAVVPAPAMVQPNTTIPTGTRARFPWKYACDMVPRIQLFINVSDDQMIQALFTTIFPNCTYTKATFYKHHAAYRAAIENSSDRVEHAVNAGYSPAGQWNTLFAEIKANAAPSLTGSNGLGSISNSDTKCPTPPPSLPMNSSTTDTGLPLPTDLTSEMNDALALLFQNIDKMDNNTAATTDPEFPLDLTSYPQFDLFSPWLNDPSPIDNQALPPLPPFN
ncbi:hypothetical protein CY34DRAFT_18284 [Suillus luteus UH-Slu-Lm8-n1]|uniref:Uncharacterized protein n=1 Tax=Suillus luteus UH-Slu-Lm8-n1 TaxID=930992 RepID=A0A0D0A5V6_9AGAM|nr:hypothetical protein CY34DRAFT_18284 [Suillus luteus UH-Slu-Lm8-n1]